MLTVKEKEFIDNHKLAHLSTVDPGGNPHVIPVVYAFNGEVIYTPVDGKPKKIEGTELQRVKNIKNNSFVSVIVDEYSEDWDKLAWVQIRGYAGITDEGAEYQNGLELLLNKYPQYTELNLSISALIVITPVKIISWRV